MRAENKYAISVEIYPTRKVGQKGRVYFCVSSNRKTKNLKTDIRATKEELTTTYLDNIVYDLKLIYCIIEHLEKERDNYTLDDIQHGYDDAKAGENPYDELIKSAGSDFEVRRDIVYIGGVYKNFFKEVKPVVSKDNSDSLFNFIDARVIDFYNDGRASSLNAFRTTKKSLSRFLDGKDVPFSDIDEQFIVEYQDYLKQSGISDSTVSFYMRVLRRILNQASEDGLLTLTENAFANVNTSIDNSGTKLKERYLTKEQMKQIVKLKIDNDERLNLARDMFLFSYYMRGIELADIAYLQESNIQGDYLVFNRRKVGNEIRTIIDPKAREIIERYRGQNEDYLFPFVKVNYTLAFTNARNLLMIQLRQIGELLKPQVDLSFSMAKATWNRLIEEANLASSLIR